MPRIVRLALAVSLLTLTPAFAQRDFSNVEITTTHVGGPVHMLEGAGGNIGVVIGDDGALLVDDQYAPLTEKIAKAVQAIDDQPLRFVVNTHWHGDHTGGNENLGKKGTVIVAHDNVRKRMSVEQVIKAFGSTVPASPAIALPVITFEDAVTFHLNGEEIHAFHVPPAHTDGDSIVHFKTSNIVHMGDLFFNKMFPFIDTSSGGDVNGVIAAAEQVLAMIDAQTKVIPGHGPLTDKAGLTAYRDMLTTVRDRVAALIADGKTLEQVLEAKPTAEFEAEWGGGFLTTEPWLGIIFDSLSK